MFLQQQQQEEQKEEEEDQWVKSSLSDVTLVAQLLIRFKDSSTPPSDPPPPPPPPPPASSSPSLVWGVKQHRSKQQQQQQQRCCNMVQGESTRASPTTPLSWSGGGGGSFSGGGGGDGYEESSRVVVKRVTSVRSKVAAGVSETINRRARKKKLTFAELKEAESFLSNESIQLKTELATLQTLFQKEKKQNKTLKALELDLQLRSAKRACTSDAPTEMAFDRSRQAESHHNLMILPSHELGGEAPPTSQPSDSLQKKDVAFGQSFVLPDLNLLPDLNMTSEEDFGSEDFLYGTS